MNFQNNCLNSIEISTIFITESSNLNISGSLFQNLTLIGSLFSIFNIFNENPLSISIENSIFSNIIWDKTKPDNLILINGPFNNINIDNVFIYDNKYAEFLIQIIDSNSSILMKSFIFQKNFVLNYALSIENALNITISNFNSLSNNNDGGLFFSGGGNIFLFNIPTKIISNLTVSLNFASKSSFGVTIIDKNLQDFLTPVT